MNYNNLISFKKGNLNFTFLPTGDILHIKNNHIMVNQLQGNFLDGSLMNIYLRIKSQDNISYCPLLGVKSDSKLSYSESGLVYTGSFKDVHYQVTFTLANENYWFWKVSLSGTGTVDVILGQDLAIASEGAVSANEAYVSQYIDHKVVKDDNFGYTITSRQNQPEAGLYPCVQNGCLSYGAHYSTDGFQFYGISYKETNEPLALTQDTLADDIYQYEFAYAALQSKTITLIPDQTSDVVFYGFFSEDKSVDDDKAIILTTAAKLYQELPTQTRLLTTVPQIKHKKMSLIETLPISADETTQMYGEKIFLEKEGEDELSYFTTTYEHIVTKSKELLVERPHGLIAQTGHETFLNEQTIATTFFMYGMFNSQIVLGNTTFHKLFSNARNHLNIFKISGQRIWIDDGTTLKLLALPSLFEMGINYGKWIYKTKDDTIEILSYTTTNDSEIHMCIKSQNKRSYKFYVTNHLVMGENEHHAAPIVSHKGNNIVFKPGKDTLVANIYPHIQYKLQVKDTPFEVMDDSIFFEDQTPRDSNLLVIGIESDQFEMSITGNLHGDCKEIAARDFTEEKDKYNALFKKITNNFKLLKNPGEEDYRMNITVWWYLHNALIHFVSPHGLEQYGGAAWGTRDICQGPFELMIAFQKYDEAREILKKVYSHQFNTTGNWPQWFMFDRYETIQADECHGDVIVWPLKALSEYLDVTNDFAILDMEIPYCDFETKTITGTTEKLIDHVKKQLQYIFSNTMFDTALSNYGNGDWDDTLQPDHEELKKSMVSSWTVALTFQTIKKFAALLEKMDPDFSNTLTEFYLRIEKDFRSYLMSDGIISGFTVMNSKENIEYLIHPRDTKTGINYRLLPMTRSIIAELFSEGEVQKHTNLIFEHLKFNDGIRLMNRPVKYLGGKTVYFKRGEQAANFGREIGLLYMHANIRYTEAMATIGNGFEAWDSLHKITPVGLTEVVSNAQYRQSNLYFSSSDADFSTRYDAYENFDKLKAGEIKVKGGWRLYSSGPGIYIKQLINSCLGIRRAGDTLIIDPILEDESNLSFDFQLDGYDVSYQYKHTGNKKVTGIHVNGTEIKINTLENRYRETGVIVSIDDIYTCLDNSALNLIEIHL